jgi:mRNA interferase RelE/StbE
MAYEIKYHPDVVEDIEGIDKGVRKKVFKKIEQLKERPLLGVPLGNRAGLDLSGYRKCYVDNRRIRIVYRIDDELIRIMVMAVGKREALEVYQIVQKRLSELNG